MRCPEWLRLARGDLRDHRADVGKMQIAKLLASRLAFPILLERTIFPYVVSLRSSCKLILAGCKLLL
jgi:hypothetical protein